MTVCILGSPTAFLPVLLEGGTRCPGGYGPLVPTLYETPVNPQRVLPTSQLGAPTPGQGVPHTRLCLCDRDWEGN